MPSESPPPAEPVTAAIPAALAGERLDRALVATLPPAEDGAPLSRSRLKALIEAGAVSLAGATISDPSRRVKAGERYAVRLPAPAPAAPEAQEMPLSILYEDADLIVIDKPAGLVVHPAPGNPDRTLVNALLAHCGASLTGIGGEKRPGIVHRLDKDTSGVMVAAKTALAHAALTRAFAARDLERAYLAIVWGVPSPPAGEVAGAIGRDPRDRKRMAVRPEGGKPALTRYRVVKAFGSAAALVECRLATGRTHQIRVHMAAIGHPVVGDPLYGRPPRRAGRRALPDAALARLKAFPRQALHARVIGFVHPRTGQALRFESELPFDIKSLIDDMRAMMGAPLPD